MRWNNKVKEPEKRPEEGDIRLVDRFLFLPLTINGETRWLEFCRYQEVFVIDYPEADWIPNEWVSE